MHVSCLSVWNIFAEFVFDCHHPSPLYFYKWGNLVPIHISLPLALWQHGRLPLLGVVALYGGFGVEAGGIGKSFLNSNKLPDLVPAPDYRVPAQVGTFLSGGGLLLGGSPCRGFYFSEFIMTLGAVLGDCVVILLVLGVNSGLATTCTLYLFGG